MADGIGWKTAELQIETLVPGILLVLGTHAVISKHFSITTRIPVPDDTFIQAALFVATAYAAGVIGSVLCRVILDRFSERGVRAWVFSLFAHADRKRLLRNRLSVDKDRFKADYWFERRNRKHAKGIAFWNAVYRSALRTTSRKTEVDRRRSQGRVLRNIALPVAVWTTVVFPPTPVWQAGAVASGFIIFLAFLIPYAYAEYVNFAEAYDITSLMRFNKENDMDTKEMITKIEKEFGSRLGFLGHQVLMLSMTGQKCDITFFKKEPAIDVKIDQQINLAMMYGAGAKKLQEMLENIKLSDGDAISIGEIWTINPMPDGGFSKEELDSVDMTEAEQEAGPNGETLREMIKNTYHCKSKDEEDHYLRTYIAS